MSDFDINSVKNNDKTNNDYAKKSRIYTKILILMLLCYGIIGLIMFAVTNIMINFSGADEFIGVYSAIIHYIRFVLFVIVILVFIAMRKSLNKNRHNILYLLDFLAVITLYIPLLRFVVAVIQIFLRLEIEYIILYNFPYNIISVMQYALTSIWLLSVGYEFRRKSYFYCSLVMLLICPVIFSINIYTKSDDIYSILLILEDRCKYLMAINYVVYIIIGFSAYKRYSIRT